MTKKDDHTQFFNDAWLTCNTETIQMFFLCCCPDENSTFKEVFLEKKIYYCFP